ncbi:MAG: beta-ketoacyl synthase N-terminal-like domain-containing protein, partial [Dehalococcoidia bacterium]
MAEDRDVVITGMGAVTPLGRDVNALWEALTAGRSGIGPITSFDATGLPCRVAGEVRDYQPPAGLDAGHARRLDRGALFAVDAAIQALADSALPLTPENAVQVGVVMGVVRPGEQTVWEAHRAFHEAGPNSMRPGYVGRTLANAPATAVAGALGLRGPALGVAASAASSSVALSIAA